jgi:hypothetical protein
MVSRAGHEDGAVPDLAQVADPGTDDRGAVSEDGALADPHRIPRRADHDTVFQHRRLVADAHRPAVRPDHQALGEYHASAYVDVAHDHGGPGDLWIGLVDGKLVEAHRDVTVLPAGEVSGPPCRGYARSGPPDTGSSRNRARWSDGTRSRYSGWRWM